MQFCFLPPLFDFGESSVGEAGSEALGQLGQPASGMALEPLDGLCPIGQCGHWNTSSELKQGLGRQDLAAGHVPDRFLCCQITDTAAVFQIIQVLYRADSKLRSRTFEQSVCGR